MTRWIGLSLIGILLIAGVAAAQTATQPTTTSTRNSSDGAFAQLPPGGQKIAQALCEAQPTCTTSATSATATMTSGPTTSGPQPLTLDQIAQMRLDGKSWPQIFRHLKEQGLTDAKNLGQVVSQFNHRHHTSSSATTITTASGRTQVIGGKPGGPSPKGVMGAESQGGSSAAVAGERSHGNASGHSGGNPGRGVGRGR